MENDCSCGWAKVAMSGYGLVDRGPVVDAGRWIGRDSAGRRRGQAFSRLGVLIGCVEKGRETRLGERWSGKGSTARRSEGEGV